MERVGNHREFIASEIGPSNLLPLTIIVFVDQAPVANTEVIYLLKNTKTSGEQIGIAMGGVANEFGDAMQAKTLAFLTKFNVFERDDKVSTIRR